MLGAMADLAELGDQELIALCLEQDAQAWEILLRRHQRLVTSIGFKFRLPPEDIVDVFQAVSLILFEQLPRLRDVRKLSSWFITVAVRECWKLRQHAGHTMTIDDPDWNRIVNMKSLGNPTIEGEFLLMEKQQHVHTAIDQLPVPCRGLLNKLFYSKEPASYEEISRVLGMPVASIGPTRGRCLAKLRNILEKSGVL